MKAWIQDGGFGLPHLKLQETDLPVPGPDQVLIRLSCTSLNYRDWLMINGQYNPHLKFPLIPLSDGVGVIESLGEGVSGFSAGDRVCPIFAPNWLTGSPPVDVFKHTLGGPADGTLRQFMLAPAEAVLRVPDYLTDEEASTLPCAALTAWNAVFTYGKIRKGDVAVVLGTGGVSVFALQLAVAAGAEVIVTSSSDRKLQIASEMGASHLINYSREKEWHKIIRKITGGNGADLVVEVSGGRTLEQSVGSLKPGGVVALIGILSGRAADFNLLPVLMRNICVQGILVGSRENFAAMNQFLGVHQIRPVIDKVFAFQDAPAALASLAEAEHFGKICIRVS